MSVEGFFRASFGSWLSAALRMASASAMSCGPAASFEAMRSSAEIKLAFRPVADQSRFQRAFPCRIKIDARDIGKNYEEVKVLRKARLRVKDNCDPPTMRYLTPWTWKADKRSL